MPLDLTQTPEGETGWAAADQLRFTEIEDFVNALEIDVVDHPHQDVNTAAAVVFDDVAVTNPSDLFTATELRHYTKDEVDEIIAGAIFGFWPTEDPDGVIGGYNKMLDAESPGAKSQVGPITIDTGEKLIQAFITPIGVPDFTVLSEGVYSFDIHAISTVGANVKDAGLRWKLYSRTQPGGVETPLIVSETGPALTNAEIHYNIHGTLPAEIELDVTDRLVLKVYGVPSGAEPQNPDVTIYMEGDTSTRIEVRTNISAFDNRYRKLDGSNVPTADQDFGGFQITNVGNVDGVDVSALKTDVDGFPDELKLLTQAEIQQVGKIGATTISVAQWAWFGVVDNLAKLTEDELAQLAFIGATTISAPQWGYLGGATGIGHYVDRGAAADWDFDIADLITDGTWRDLNISGIVPAGATAVLLNVRIADNLTSQELYIRDKTLGDNYNYSRFITQVGGIHLSGNMLIGLPTDRILEYFATNTAWEQITIHVMGWWVP